MGSAKSDSLHAVETAAAEVSAHRRAGSVESLYNAEVVLEKAIDAAATAGHSVDEILAAGAAAPLEESQLRKALAARSSNDRGREA